MNKKYILIREELNSINLNNNSSADIKTFYLKKNLNYHNKGVNTIAVYYESDWEKHSLPQALNKLGPFRKVSVPSYPNSITSRDQTCKIICNKVRILHAQIPADWVFFYVNGWMVLKEDIKKLRSDLNIPFVLMSLDDKHNFYEKKLGTQYTGTADLCSEFDLYWTSSRLAVDWVKSKGGNPLYLPEGANPEMFYPDKVEKNIDVSFIGANYGIRGSFISKLRKYGLTVNCFGRGWHDDSFISTEIMRNIYSRSKINLGIGYASSSDLFTNVKGRDFEIPMTGGGMYLTTYNPDLSLHYIIGSEIVCYRSVEEAVELIRYYLHYKDESIAIAEKGYMRAQKEHSWESRFGFILKHL